MTRQPTLYRASAQRDHNASRFDTPTFRWLPAKFKITTHFLMFYARIPEGFAKVDDVRLENGQIILADHIAKKPVRRAASWKL